MSTNPFDIYVLGSDEEELPEWQDAKLTTSEKLRKLKFELFTSEMRLNTIQTENAQLRFKNFTLENQVLVLEKELDETKEQLAELEIINDRKRSVSPPLKRKSNDNIHKASRTPLKYVIERFNKHVEEPTLKNYFIRYGNVKMITLREKGIEKHSKPYSSAILEFEKIFCDDLTERPHEVQGEPMLIRKFVKGKDEIKPAPGWSDEETDFTPTKCSRRSPSIEKFRCSLSPIARSKSSAKHRSPPRKRPSPPPLSFLKHKGPRTRSILVRGPPVKGNPKKILSQHFNKFGAVHSVTIRDHSVDPLKFVKFISYSSADKAMEQKIQTIDGKRYEILPARDL